METNLNSWLHQLLSHQQSSYLNSLSHPLNLGTVNSNPPLMNPCAKVTSPNRTLTEIASSGVSYPKQWQPNEFHCHQAINDAANTLSPEKAPNFFRNEKSDPHNEKSNAANPGSGLAQKRFLVFDQSGDQTTLFFSPGICPPVQVQVSTPSPKLNFDYQTDKFQHQEPILTYEYHEKLSDDVESEMREDTEEINALLYSSDDDYYYEEDEEASTGHSPSTMTAFEKLDWGEDHEQVGSNFGPNKRIKLSKVDTKCYSQCEDDAESSCGDEQNRDFSERTRKMKDSIRNKVSLIQSIIPERKGTGENAILILDEAIDYLKSLKVKAQALGIKTI